MDFPNCAVLDTCDYSAVAVLAWEWVKEQLGTANRLYSHWSIVMPQSSACNREWAALGSIGA